MLKKIISIGLVLVSLGVSGQVVYEHHSYENIYAFLDELANEGIIELNAVSQPYSRKYILSKLEKAAITDRQLNKRQQKELSYYLTDYGFDKYEGKDSPVLEKAELNIFSKTSNFATAVKPMGLFYKDSFLTLAARPIWGFNLLRKQEKDVRHFWGGASFYATLGKHVGVYASLRDNSMNEILSQPSYFNQREGGNYKVGVGGRPGGDYSEMRGGITFSWKWGSLGLIKDQLQWGSHYHTPAILSGHYPSPGMVKLTLSPAKWIDFTYFHGWLVSEVIDSSRSYLTVRGDYRGIYRSKFMAANLASIKPYDGIVLSFGNSIIYSDLDFQAAYFIPVMFYKSIDHTIHHGVDNQNSQMYADLSIRLIPHVHLFSTLYIDEFSFTRIGDPERHNFYAVKAGMGITNWPLDNLHLHGEYVKSMPLTYKHRIPSLTFATNQYNLGYFMRDNSQTYYVDLLYKPLRGLQMKASYLLAKHGNEYEYTFDAEYELDELPFMEDITWKNETLELGIQYEFTTNSYLNVKYALSHIQGYEVDGLSSSYYLNLFSPGFYHGNNQVLTLGFNVGF